MQAVHEPPVSNPAESTMAELARQWEGQSVESTLVEAVRAFGDRLVLASSLGPEDLVLTDMLYKIQPRANAFFIDTGFHFPETLALLEQVQSRYPELHLEIVRPLFTVAEQAAKHGERLYEREPDTCCAIRKVEPLNRVLRSYKAWITGMRREQSPTRAAIGVVQWDSRRGMVKFNPLAAWTHKQVWAYVVAHKLPYNPLHDRGYPSIGCSPRQCTAPVVAGADPRSGRWTGKGKLECGLHT
jgi:phosphoadenosine phosphosulfate reductase